MSWASLDVSWHTWTSMEKLIYIQKIIVLSGHYSFLLLAYLLNIQDLLQ